MMSLRIRPIHLWQQRFVAARGERAGGTGSPRRAAGRARPTLVTAAGARAAGASDRDLAELNRVLMSARSLHDARFTAYRQVGGDVSPLR